MAFEISLTEREKHPLDLVGSFVEIYWNSTSRMAKRQCEKCVYLVRGLQPGMVCVELIYDAIEGVHKHESIYWVPIEAVQYMRVLTERRAKHRIETLEREVHQDMPRD
ncbi:MAG: hypothetical protein MUC92_11045 [Fimbriimonadaceae bacterium]|jgi:hypothetical protein|nr:hypothetical protein [Fimbriimonadaceae bacterium]